MENVKIENYPPNEKPKGMYVPKWSTGIKITHIPTGVFVISDTERSSHLNRVKAEKELSILLNEDLKRGDV